MIKEYIEFLRYTKGYSENTIKSYETCLRNFTKSMAVYQLRWSTINQNHIQNYLSSVLANGKSASTIVQYISAIRGIYRWIGNKYGIENPTRYLQAPKKTSLIPHIIDVESVSKAILNESNEQIRIGIALMVGVGLRVSEVLNMRYEDIDRVSGRVLIMGKGRKERYIYLPQPILLMLTKDAGHIISYQDRAFRYMVYLAFRRIGVYCSPHMLRHTFASMAIDNGMRLDVLREVLGHTSLATTQIYLHTRQSVVREEMQKCIV